MKASHERKVIKDTETEIANRLFLRHNQILKGNYVDNIDVGLTISRTWTRGRGMWDCQTNKFSVKVGGYTNKTVTFRQLKNGGFNYDNIADKLNEKATLQAQINKRKQIIKTSRVINADFVSDLYTKLGIDNFAYNLQVTTAGLIDFKINQISKEHAELITKYAVDIGAIPTNNS